VLLRGLPHNYLSWEFVGHALHWKLITNVMAGGVWPLEFRGSLVSWISGEKSRGFAATSLSLYRAGHKLKILQIPGKGGILAGLVCDAWSTTPIHKYRVIQTDGLIWTVNGASTHARQLVAVFQVRCSPYGLTCYAQNSLEFVTRSPLIHLDGRSFYLYTDSLFAQTGDSNGKCSSSLEVECWNEDETQGAQQSPSQF